MNGIELIKKYYWVFILLLIFSTAMYLRGIPGTKLTYPRLQAIDPYFFFRIGESIIDNGYLMNNDTYTAYGTLPNGIDRNLQHIFTYWSYPIMYFMLNPLLGVSWYWIAVWIPAFFGALQIIFMFILVRELFNKEIGLLSAGFLAFVPGVIFRSSAGFIEKEPLGAIFMLIMLWFFVKAIKKDNFKENILYGFLSGFFMFMMAGTWGGVRIFMIGISAFVVVSLLINKYSKSLFYSYIVMWVSFFVLSRIFISVVLPWAGFEMWAGWAGIAILVFRYLIGKCGKVEDKYMPYVVPAAFLLALFGVFIVAYVNVDFGFWVNGIIQRVFNPISIGVIPSTVAESQGLGNFFITSMSNFGTQYAISAFGLPQFLIYLSMIYFSFMGITMMVFRFVIRRKLEHEIIFVMVLFVITMIISLGAQRLAFLFSFFVAITAGYCIFKGAKFIIFNIEKSFLQFRYLNHVKVVIGVFVGTIIIVNLASGWVVSNGIGTSLDNSWYSALTWIRDNTANDSVVLEWWDYGYWFQYVAKRRVMVDGGYHAQNPTQDIAKFYTEPLSENSLNFLKKYNLSYVMVSPDLIPKFGAMSKIANWGKRVDTLPIFRLRDVYQEGEKKLLTFSFAGQDILVAYVEVNANQIANITALMKGPGGQAYIQYIAIGNQIIKNPKGGVESMVYLAGDSLIFIPEPVKDCVFVKLYLFNGFGYEEYFEKVYDKMGMKIYKVKYENFPKGVDEE